MTAPLLRLGWCVVTRGTGPEASWDELVTPTLYESEPRAHARAARYVARTGCAADHARVVPVYVERTPPP